MHGLVIAVALAALPSQRAASVALADYMSALAAAQKRWARMAALMLDNKVDEARALAQRLPPVLAEDFGEFDRMARVRDDPSVDTPLAWALWALRRGQPALAVPLFEKASEAQVAMNTDQRNEWFRACLQTGDLACVARVAPDVQLTETERGGVDALAAGTLAPLEALQARVGALHGIPSTTLAVEQWALLPSRAGDRLERLRLVRDLLPRAGRRLANKALAADPALPVPAFVSTVIDLVYRAPTPDLAFESWELMASHARVAKDERARALLQMGLIRQRQGRSAEAAREFHKALPLEGLAVPAAALQIGHIHLQEGRYEEALATYRQAESLHRDAVAWLKTRNASHDYGSRFMPYVLYRGISLEHLGRVHEAMAEYASILLDAPMGWRRPLGLHVVEMYDTAGRLDVLERFLDGVGERRYAETIPIRTLMIAHRLEKEGDWRSLAAQIEAADRSGPRGGPVFRVDGGRTYAPMAAAHALARHCDDALPLLPPPASEPQAEVRPWARYTRGLCAGKSDVRKPYIGAQSEVDLPEVGFPPVKPVDLPDPIVCAEHAAPWKQPDLSKQPCP